MSGAVALVTGAASGIGAATARLLAARGWRVAAGTFAGDPHQLSATTDAIAADGGLCMPVIADVRSTAQMEAAVAAVVQEWGRLDAVVANAALMRSDPFDTLTDEHWNSVLDVDLTGVMRTCRAAAGVLTAGGTITCVGSIIGSLHGWAGHSHYAASKAGVVGLVRSLALELASRGIRVNAVLPGLTATPQLLDSRTSIGPQGARAAARTVPVGRIADAEEIARVVAFLASTDSSYVTGHALVADGGLSAVMPQ